MARSRRGRDQLAGAAAASVLLDDEAAEGGNHHDGGEDGSGQGVEGEGGSFDAAAAARTRLGRRYTEEVGCGWVGKCDWDIWRGKVCRFWLMNGGETELARGDGDGRMEHILTHMLNTRNPPNRLITNGRSWSC